ncbi:MAG: aminotransferase class V-fold PLP-dependent enzyme [Propionibacteriaceae bacterium]|jgi:glutamate/tyrosine decarboxylase-like PLP-dependent enzyme|nr:aminotransferase class V-fold PLP-dependent enzyme [Propionibacteriaceae bacterium]
MTFSFARTPDAVLTQLQAWRAADAPTSGGQVLAYVFDTGLPQLDELVRQAMVAMTPVSGLDPATFPSFAELERALVGFTRELLHGDDDVVGTATTGGTESSLLAVKAARDLWQECHQGVGRPRMVLPTTAHGTFRKAADYFDLELDLVPCQADGSVDPAAVGRRLDDGVAIVITSAPSYPFGVIDPVAEIAAQAYERGIACHVDACMGGLTLPFWPGVDELPVWDFRLPGVTSVVADYHKFGYAPKGVSVLLQRGRQRQRRQFYVCADWAGYPLTNPAMVNSRSGLALAAAWAVSQALGRAGFVTLTESVAEASAVLRRALKAIDGLTVFGSSIGPMIAAATDLAAPPERQVDPHLWADALRQLGWVVQSQPGLTQANGVNLPTTAHLTVTPVTQSRLPELEPALIQAADLVRGVPPVDGSLIADHLVAAGLLDPMFIQPPNSTTDQSLPRLDPDTAWAIVQALNQQPDDSASTVSSSAQTRLLALAKVVALPVTEALMIEKMGRPVEP